MIFLICLLLIFKQILAVTSGKSYYAVLGLSPKADETEIKKAYRKLAMKVVWQTIKLNFVDLNFALNSSIILIKIGQIDWKASKSSRR
jgi:hypothetical protein